MNGKKYLLYRRSGGFDGLILDNQHELNRMFSAEMKPYFKDHMMNNFLAPAIAVCLLGTFGAVCIGLIHRFSYGFIIFAPLTGAVLVLLLIISLIRAARIQKK